MVVELFQNYICKFMTLQIIPLPLALLYLESVKREGKITKVEYLENEKSFFDEIKKHFS